MADVFACANEFQQRVRDAARYRCASHDDKVRLPRPLRGLAMTNGVAFLPLRGGRKPDAAIYAVQTCRLVRLWQFLHRRAQWSRPTARVR